VGVLTWRPGQARHQWTGAHQLSASPSQVQASASPNSGTATLRLVTVSAMMDTQAMTTCPMIAASTTVCTLASTSCTTSCSECSREMQRPGQVNHQTAGDRFTCASVGGDCVQFCALSLMPQQQMPLSPSCGRPLTSNKKKLDFVTDLKKSYSDGIVEPEAPSVTRKSKISQGARGTLLEIIRNLASAPICARVVACDACARASHCLDFAAQKVTRMTNVRQSAPTSLSPQHAPRMHRRIAVSNRVCCSPMGLRYKWQSHSHNARA